MIIKNIRKNKISEFILLIVLIFLIAVEIISIKSRLSEKSGPKQENITDKKAGLIKGPVRTRGMDLYDNNDRKIIVRGINYDEMTPKGYVYEVPDLTNLPDVCKIWNQPPTKLDAKQVKDWGFNAVRLPITWHSLESQPPQQDISGNWRHSWNEDYLGALDELIAEISNLELAVILDMHQYLWSPAFKYIQSEDGVGCGGSGFPEWLYPEAEQITFQQARCDFFKGVKYPQSPINPREGFSEVWKFIAKRYRDNPQVIAADLINEPWSARDICTPDELNLNDFYLELGEQIRSQNPDLLIIYEDSQDNADNNFSLINRLPLPNSVYSFHLYSGNFIPDGKKRLDKYFERAKKWQVPLFVGEFDAFAKSVNQQYLNSDWQKDTDELMTYMKEREISWAFWSYSGYYSLLIPGTYQPKTDLLESLQRGL